MNEEMRRRMAAIAGRRVTPQQEASYYLAQYMTAISDEEMNEADQNMLSNYWLALYWMAMEDC